MGRGYQTAPGQFLDNTIYQPPWELMMQAGAMKQQGYDDSLAQAELINGMLKFDYINDEVENENARNEKQYWESQIQDITNEIKTTGNYRKAMPRIREAQKGIMESMTSGNISKMTQSAAVRDKHLKAMTEAAKNKDASLPSAQAAYSTFMKNWREQETRSMEGSLGYEDIINTPDELKAKNVMEMAKNVPEWKNSTFSVNPKGGYFITTNSNTVSVSKEALLETINASIMSNPDLMPYLQQQQRIGMGTYFNEDGSMIPAYTNAYYTPSGERLDYVTAKGLPPEQRKNLRQIQEFAPNSLGQAHRLGSSVNYERETSQSNHQINQVDENKKNRAHQWDMQKDRQDFTKDMEDLKHLNRVKIKALDQEKGELARQQIGDLTATLDYNSIGNVGNAPLGGLLDLAQSGQFGQSEGVKIDAAFAAMTKDMKGPQLEAYNRMLPLVKSGEVTTAIEANAFLFKELYPTPQDYLTAKGISKEKTQEALDYFEQNPNGEITGGINRENLAKLAEYKGIKNIIDNQYGQMASGVPPSFLGIKEDMDKFTGYETFSDKFKTYIDDNYNAATISKEFEPVGPEASKKILEIVNQNLSEYDIILAETGKYVVPKKGEEVTFVKNKGITGASGRAISQTIFEGSDGKNYIAIPKSEFGAAEVAIRKIGRDALPENSRVRQELVNTLRSGIEKKFNEAEAVRGSRESITIVDNNDHYGTGSRITRNVNGTYKIAAPIFGIVQDDLSEELFHSAMVEIARVSRIVNKEE